jgi:RHS repeat-associated protein
LNKKVTQATNITNTDYLAGFQYKNSVLQFFPHAEGYVNATQNGTSYTFNYVYNYTDHLGNIRLSYSLDPSTNVLKIIEENHYYPFGLKHTGYNSDQMMYVKEASVLKIKPKPPLFKTSYTDKFNGQSWETDLGLNVTAMDYRQYDNALGRFNSMDPLAEKYVNISTYGYCLNNPIIFVDPNGKEVVAHDKDAQDLILNALTELLGANHGFSFNKKGVMKHSGSKEHRNDKKNYSKEQMSIFEGFTEIMSNKEYTIDVFKQSGDDTSYSADFKNRNFSTDSNGQIIKDSNGNPILKEDGTVTTVDVTHPNAGETGGGVFLTKEGHKNAVSIIFPDIANGRKFKAFTGFTTPSVNSVTVHELLDHGLDFVRTGNNKASSTPSVSNVSYQNDALIIIQSNTRVGHDKQ